MFCQQCGHSLSPSARHCAFCGAAVPVAPPAEAVGGFAQSETFDLAPEPAAAQTMAVPLSYADSAAPVLSDDRPVIVARPVFVGWATVVPIIPIQLFMTVWAGGFFGGFSSIGLRALNHAFGFHVMPISPFLFFGALAFFGIPLGTYFSKRYRYARTEYRFFRDRMEYYDGSVMMQLRTIQYRNVFEVDLKKGLFQQQYGLGTVILGGAGVSGYVGSSNRYNRGGMQVADIENPDRVYAEVKELVRRAQAP